MPNDRVKEVVRAVLARHYVDGLIPKPHHWAYGLAIDAVLAGIELAAEVAAAESAAFDDTIAEAIGYGHPEETVKSFRCGKAWTAEVAVAIRALAGRKEP
jgi:hypothetical protein